MCVCVFIICPYNSKFLCTFILTLWNFNIQTPYIILSTFIKLFFEILLLYNIFEIYFILHVCCRDIRYDYTLNWRRTSAFSTLQWGFQTYLMLITYIHSVNRRSVLTLEILPVDHYSNYTVCISIYNAQTLFNLCSMEYIIKFLNVRNKIKFQLHILFLNWKQVFKITCTCNVTIIIKQ